MCVNFKITDVNNTTKMKRILRTGIKTEGNPTRKKSSMENTNIVDVFMGVEEESGPGEGTLYGKVGTIDIVLYIYVHIHTHAHPFNFGSIPLRVNASRIESSALNRDTSAPSPGQK